MHPAPLFTPPVACVLDAESSAISCTRRGCPDGLACKAWLLLGQRLPLPPGGRRWLQPSRRASPPTPQVPESLVARRSDVVARLKSLDAAVRPITEFLSNEDNVKLLKQDKTQNQAFLQKEFNIGGWGVQGLSKVRTPRCRACPAPALGAAGLVRQRRAQLWRAAAPPLRPALPCTCVSRHVGMWAGTQAGWRPSRRSAACLDAAIAAQLADPAGT